MGHNKRMDDAGDDWKQITPAIFTNSCSKLILFVNSRYKNNNQNARDITRLDAAATCAVVRFVITALR